MQSTRQTSCSVLRITTGPGQRTGLQYSYRSPPTAGTFAERYVQLAVDLWNSEFHRWPRPGGACPPRLYSPSWWVSTWGTLPGWSPSATSLLEDVGRGC